MELGRLEELLKAGTEASLTLLYEEMKREVFVYALTFVKDIYSAEDVRQEVFLKVLRSAGTFMGGNVRAWIYTITRNAALDYVRRNVRHAEMDENFAYSGMNGCIEDKIFLDRLMRILPSKEKEIVLLHLAAGYTMPEAAELLKLPLTTVKWRYHAAISRLKKKLKLDESN